MILRRRSPSLACWLVLPCVLLVGAVVAFPLLLCAGSSLFRLTAQAFRGTIDFAWLAKYFAGVANYVSTLTEPAVWQAWGRTAYFGVVSIALELAIGVPVALLLHRRFYGCTLLRALVLIPWALPITIDAVMWKWIFNTSYGAANGILLACGATERVQWLSSPDWAMHAVIVAEAWKVTPLVVLLTLAARQTIPDELYEAATVDGADRVDCFWHVTLPLLTPTLVIILIIRTLDAFRVFDVIYVMTRGGPANATKVVSYYVYEEIFKRYHYGQAASLSMVITLVGFALAYAYVRAMRMRQQGQEA